MSGARAVRIAFGLALFLALLWVAGPAELAAVLARARPLPLAAAALSYALMVAVKTERWRTVVRMQDLSVPRREALRAYGLGMLLGAVTPGRVGQHVKALALTQRGAPAERALAGTIVDQLLDMTIVAVLVPVAVGYFGVRVSGSAWIGAASVALCVLGIAVVARSSRGRFAAATAEALRLGRRAIGRPLALAALSSLLFFVTLDRVATAVGMEVGFVTVALASVASAVVELAPVTVAGLGTREAALLVLLGPLGVGMPTVLAFTLAIRTLQLATGALAYLAGSGRIDLPRRASASV